MGYLIGFLVALIVAGLILYIAAMILALIGVGLVMGLDFVAYGFTWLGVRDPAIGWLILGVLGGGTIGLAQGFKRAGRGRDSPKVYIAGMLFFVVVLPLASYAALSAPTLRVEWTRYLTEAPGAKPSPPTKTRSKPKPLRTAANVAGQWEGSYTEGVAGRKFEFGLSLSQGVGPDSDKTTGTTKEVYVAGGKRRVRTAKIAGRIDGNEISFGKRYDDDPSWLIHYRGWVADNRNVVKGKWEAATGSGTWVMTRVGVGRTSPLERAKALWRDGACPQVAEALSEALQRDPNASEPYQVAFTLLVEGGRCHELPDSVPLLSEALRRGIDLSSLPLLVEIETAYGMSITVRPQDIQGLERTSVELKDGSRYQGAIRIKRG